MQVNPIDTFKRNLMSLHEIIMNLFWFIIGMFVEHFFQPYLPGVIDTFKIVIVSVAKTIFLFFTFPIYVYSFLVLFSEMNKNTQLNRYDQQHGWNRRITSRFPIIGEVSLEKSHGIRAESMSETPPSTVDHALDVHL